MERNKKDYSTSYVIFDPVIVAFQSVLWAVDQGDITYLMVVTCLPQVPFKKHRGRL